MAALILLKFKEFLGHAGCTGRVEPAATEIGAVNTARYDAFGIKDLPDIRTVALAPACCRAMAASGLFLHTEHPASSSGVSDRLSRIGSSDDVQPGRDRGAGDRFHRLQVRIRSRLP